MPEFLRAENRKTQTTPGEFVARYRINQINVDKR